MVVRSFLSVPASRPDRFVKALRSGADAVILDLEDAVAPAQKDSARDGLIANLDETQGQLIVRVNAPGTAWCVRDLETCAMAPRVSAIMLPKVESAADIVFADLVCRGAEARAGRTDAIGIYALIESAGGIANVREIAGASRRVQALVLGYADLTASMGRPRGAAGQWLFAQESLLTAARANGIGAIDGPCLDTSLTDEFRDSVQTAVALGFDGKWVIHPAQIAEVNSAFAPRADDVARAREITSAMARATNSGLGVVAIDGSMVDEAVARWARRVLERAGE